MSVARAVVRAPKVSPCFTTAAPLRRVPLQNILISFSVYINRILKRLVSIKPAVSVPLAPLTPDPAPLPLARGTTLATVWCVATTCPARVLAEDI